MNLAATITIQEATQRQWAVVIIGAGPAGSFLARELARAGIEVLLVDRSEFPRWKVCGCCLNGAALAVLDGAGLGQLVTDRGAIPLERVHLAAGCGAVDLRLPAGAALSRESFDAGLIEAAITEGVSFLPGTFARVAGATEKERKVTLAAPTRGESTTTARIVVAADGLAGLSLSRDAGHRVRARQHSRIGAGAVVLDAPPWFQPGAIYMACGEGGYLGAVRLEDGRLDLAAALDPEHVRQHGGLPGAVAAIIRARGWPDIATSLSWRGTPLLSRQPLVPAGQRYFIVGDAAGYVEPFTGEGMAWALASAAALTSLIELAVASWKPAMIHEWSHRLHQSAVAPPSPVSNVDMVSAFTDSILRDGSPSAACAVPARPFLAGLNRPLRSPACSSYHPAARVS